MGCFRSFAVFDRECRTLRFALHFVRDLPKNKSVTCNPLNPLWINPFRPLVKCVGKSLQCVWIERIRNRLGQVFKPAAFNQFGDLVQALVQAFACRFAFRCRLMEVTASFQPPGLCLAIAHRCRSPSLG